MGATDFCIAAPPGAGARQGGLIGVRTLAAALAIASAVPAMANDGIAAQSAGGIVFGKTDAVAMKKEVLSVSAGLIKVEYEFLNESQSDVEETIFFPLPEYAAGYHGSPTYYGQPQQFTIEVDGKRKPYDTNFVAMLAGKDVTARLRQLGLTDQQIAYFPSHTPFDQQVASLSEAQRAILLKEGLLAQLYDEEWVPAWTVKVSYLWQQTFPAGKVVRVRHQYAPFVAAGSAATYLGDDKEFERKYCTDQGFQKTWQRLAARAGENGVVNAVAVSYILTTGNTWKNGIEDFSLNLIKGKPDELISLCFPGTFTKVNPTTLQVRLRNFRPQQDLDVYFGNVEGSGMHEGVAPAIRP
ncbi:MULTISPECIES: DUF4424 family protein [unclassified Janthinobacterium]|uniref:DUF4424 family protein n=1 Tax=unclassified Janthinobacterium TaxID=2610881 RepID=UPI00160AF614|nr:MULTISPECIES: DUF4424 family protein [unclassified Janthinobacterium]MBB5605977.1 hypothetical protein [Janthinobacterium sp. S3T4]MBB5611105.1 hypothetical protein [Janthinobacterium sp. S3M3]